MYPTNLVCRQQTLVGCPLEPQRHSPARSGLRFPPDLQDLNESSVRHRLRAKDHSIEGSFWRGFHQPPLRAKGARVVRILKDIYHLITITSGWASSVHRTLPPS